MRATNEDFDQKPASSRLQLTMYFAYQGQQRADFAEFETTFEAAKAGKRTSTLRKREWYTKTPWQYESMLKLQVGDQLIFWSGRKVGQGESLIVKLIEKPVEWSGNLPEGALEELSQLEGWTVDYLKANGYQRPELGFIQLRYIPIEFEASEKETKKQDDNLSLLSDSIHTISV